MNHPEVRGMAWLKLVAWLQGALIAGLAFLLWRGNEPLAAPAPEAPVAPHAAEPDMPAEAARRPAAEPQSATGASQPVVAAPAAGTEPAGTILYGCVVDEGGAPVRDCYLSFMREGESKPFASASTQSTTAFAVAGLAPGSVEIRTRVTGFRELREMVAIPADKPRLRHDVVLHQAWNLLVRIDTPAGQPLHEALGELAKARPALSRVEVGIIATPFQPDGDFPPTDLREMAYGVGHWRSTTGFDPTSRGVKIGKEYAGTVELDQRRSLWLSAVLRHRLLTTVAVEPGQAEATLVVAPDRVLQDLGTIRARVVDGATGQPVPDAMVAFNDVQSGGGSDRTDAQGAVEVHDLRPGLLRAEVRTRNRQGPLAEVLLAPGQTLDLGDLPVVEFRQIKGRCENRDEKSDRLSVYAYPLDLTLPDALQPDPYRGQVDNDGAFTLYMPDGRYSVRASGAGGTTATIDTRTLGSEPIVLRLQRESAFRLDARTNGELMQLRIIGADGRSVFKRWMQDGWKFPIAALPGEYRVELQDRAGRVTTRKVQLGAEGLDLRVP